MEKKEVVKSTEEVICSFDIYYLKKLLKGISEGEMFLLRSKHSYRTCLAIVPNSKKRKTIKALACRRADDLVVEDTLTD